MGLKTDTLPVVRDPRGNLAFVQESELLKFPVSSTYWIYDVPDGTSFRGRCSEGQYNMIIALSGSFDVISGDSAATLRRGNQAVQLPPGTEWRIEEFSTNSVALVIVSDTSGQHTRPSEPTADAHISSSINDCKILELPTDTASPGRLTEVKNAECEVMDVKRVFYLFDVPSAATRGGHSHFVDKQLIVAVSGSFTVVVDDGVSRREFMLNRPNQGLYIPQGIWRELKDFSTGSISMVLTSEAFQESDYVREYDRFIDLTKPKRTAPGSIPVINLLRENEMFGLNRISGAISAVVQSGRYVGGAEVERFEKSLAEITGTSYAVGVSNGLDALRLIFKSYIELGRLRPGDEVIVPANTYIASVLAVTDAGLTPVFCEPDPETLNLDSQAVESLITPRTRAILVVHLFGRACWDDTMRRISLRHNLIVVEDNAQAIGASCSVPGISVSNISENNAERGFNTGNLGHAAAFSFYPTKNIGALGDAGAVTTNDAELAGTVRALANYGSYTRYKNTFRGYNCRLDPVQAAVLRLKLGLLSEICRRRREVAAMYDRLITNPLVRKPLISSPDRSVWHQYVVRVADRDRFRAFLAEHGISTDVHYPTPPHRQECYRQYSGLDLPVTEEIARSCVSLPVSATITDAEITTVAEAINKFI